MSEIQIRAFAASTQNFVKKKMSEIPIRAFAASTQKTSIATNSRCEKMNTYTMVEVACKKKTGWG